MKQETIGMKFLYGMISVLFFAVMYATFASDTAIPKIAGMVMIPIALVFFLIKPEFELAHELKNAPLMMFAQLVVIILASFVIWIVDIQKANYMISGLQRLLYQTINITVVFCSVYVLRERAVEVAFLAALSDNLLKFVLAVRECGVSTMFSDIITSLTTGDQTGILTKLELNSLTYSIGLFALYYTLFSGNISKKKRIIYIVLSNFMFFLGFKRIGLLGIAVSYIIYFFFRKKSEKSIGRWCITIGLIVTIACIIYIPIVRFDIFTKVLSSLNITVNARGGLYNQVKDQYAFSPTFLGKGYGYIVKYLDYLKTLKIRYEGSSAHFIHNDVLVYYIELGFWGFIGWLLYNCVVFQRWFIKHYGASVGLLYCVMTVYNYISYLTDNMATNYPVTLSFRIILLSVICHIISERDNKTIESIKK